MHFLIAATLFVSALGDTSALHPFPPVHVNTRTWMWPHPETPRGAAERAVLPEGVGLARLSTNCVGTYLVTHRQGVPLAVRPFDRTAWTVLDPKRARRLRSVWKVGKPVGIERASRLIKTALRAEDSHSWMAACSGGQVESSGPAGVPPDSIWRTQIDPTRRFRYRYPSTLLDISVEGATVTLSHSVPYVHEFTPHGEVDVGGAVLGEEDVEVTITLKEFTDFMASFRYDPRALSDIVSDNRANTPSWVHGDKLDIIPNFIERIRMGALDGYCVTSGAHFMGERAYYFPFEDGYIVASRPMNPTREQGNPQVMEQLNRIPGIILEDVELALFERIMASVEPVHGD